MSHVYPLIVWGSADDLSAWSQSGTCAASGSQADPFGGTGAYTLTDDDGAAAEARYKEYTATYTGYHVATVFVIPSTGTQNTAVKFENTTLADSGTANLAWASYVPTLSTSGTGVLQPVSVGNGFYVQRITKYATAGNTMRITLYPSGTTTSETSSAKYYVRNATLLDVLDNPVAWEEPRDGSSWAQGGSGAEDAWIQGTDFRFSATVQWVPKIDRDTPASVSGWGLPLERVGVNCGVSSLLRAGRNKEALTFYASRMLLDSYYATSCLLVEPLRGAPTLQPNGDRSFTLDLRGITAPFQPVETE